MNAARTLLVRQASRTTTPVVGRALMINPGTTTTAASATATANQINSRGAVVIACSTGYHRTFAAAAAAHKPQKQQQQQPVAAMEECVKTQENVSMVRDAICRMLEKNSSEAETKPISNEELERILAKFAVSQYS